MNATKTKEASKPKRDMDAKSLSEMLGGVEDGLSFRRISKRERARLRRATVKSADLIMFTNQLSVMMDSGVVLSDALDAISQQQEHGNLRDIIEQLSEQVKSGDNFSTALGEYPNVFSAMFISVVKASEASGRMSEMLQVLSGYLEFEAETRKQIKSALTYPFIMALMAVAATGTLMFFVLPRFMRIYEARGAALPKLTRVLVGVSHIIGDMELMTMIITGIIFAGFGLNYWSKTESGMKILDYIKIRTPVLSTMFIDTVITRSMRIMATMVGTGVNLIDTIAVMEGSCDNYYFKRLWADVAEKIKDGYQVSESVQICQQADLIDPGIIQMLRAGEKSGKLGQVSDKISVFYEKKLQASIKDVMTLIEPLMITILGIIIGTIAIALLLPVFRISSVVSQ